MNRRELFALIPALPCFRWLKKDDDIAWLDEKISEEMMSVWREEMIRNYKPGTYLALNRSSGKMYWCEIPRKQKRGRT